MTGNSFTFMSFQGCMIFFLLWNTKDNILKSSWVQIALGPIDFHCTDKKKKKKTRIIQNVLCVPQKKVNHSSFEMTLFLSLYTIITQTHSDGQLFLVLFYLFIAYLRYYKKTCWI